ncbi:MAG TPA: amidohydrolase family protein [Stellaceae bacterium]|nr:amidohydrolase family protein [Stellaceae bacterium]
MVERVPGSREEDAWLSDEQLEQVAPAESEPFQGPVPTRMISNGEYMPFPQTRQQKQVEERVKELADHAAQKLGITRRRFLESSGGMAASFIAMNQVFGKPFFKVSHEEMFDDGAREEHAPPRDLFVFDDQTHIVRSSSNSPQSLRALAQGPGAASTAAGFAANPNNGRGGNPAGVDELGNAWTPWNPTQLLPDSPPNPGPPTTAMGEFHLGQYINRMYLQAQTSVSIISNANLGLFTPTGGGTSGNHNISESLQAEILTGWQTGQCRDYINQLAGSTRALAHGQLYVGIGNLADPMFGDYTRWQIDNMHPDSWKGYNVAAAAKVDNDPSSLMLRWRLDDEAVAYPIYQIIAQYKHLLKTKPGFFNFCIHKGLSANATQPGGANNMPQFGNPDDIVKVATDWPQFNWIIYHACMRPGFWMLQALQDIENLTGAMPPTTLTDSHGHTVPNLRWSTQFAQIAGGRYVAGAEPTSNSPSSYHRLPNVYAELGTTMASMIVTFPTVWAHLIGQLLYYMGEDNIVFGSDSLWYGGPQWQIEALWRSQIPDDIADRWKYPQLTKAAKRKILGLNSARLYKLSANTDRYRQGNLASYITDPRLQPGGDIDAVLQGVGYPTPVTPASLIPDDNFTTAKRWAEDERRAHSNTRFGWMRT